MDDTDAVDHPPVEMSDPPLLLRRHRPDDAEALSAAIGESAEHLRPWMAWASSEPATAARYREVIADFDDNWSVGASFNYGMWVGPQLVGGCGLHRRATPRALEIGYWLHAAHIGRGYATTAARLLAIAALDLDDIDAVLVSHDPANAASAAVPRRLGFVDLGVVDGARRWRIERGQWPPLPGPVPE